MGRKAGEDRDRERFPVRLNENTVVFRYGHRSFRFGVGEQARLPRFADALFWGPDIDAFTVGEVEPRGLPRRLECVDEAHDRGVALDSIRLRRSVRLLQVLQRFLGLGNAFVDSFQAMSSRSAESWRVCDMRANSNTRLRLVFQAVHLLLLAEPADREPTDRAEAAGTQLGEWR